MADIISLQELADAKLDAQSLEQFINGDVDEEVLTRLSQQYPTIKKLLLEFQKYNSRAYKTYALMDADKANIPAKSKVTVTNDATASNNGDWQWDGSTFTKSAYDLLTQANARMDANPRFKSVDLTGTENFDTLPEGRYFIPSPAVATALDAQLPPTASAPKVGWINKTYYNNSLVELKFTRYTQNANGEYEVFRKTSNGGSSSLVWLDWQKDVSRYEFENNVAKVNIFPNLLLTQDESYLYQASTVFEDGFPTLVMDKGGIKSVFYDVPVNDTSINVGKLITFTVEGFCDATGDNAGDITLQALNATGTGIATSTVSKITTANTWQKLTTSLTIPANTAKLRFRFINRNGAGNTVCKFRDAYGTSNYKLLKYINNTLNSIDSNSIFFVSKAGSDSNKGTEALPFLTLQKAIDSLPLSGGVIELGGGIYRETATLTTKGTVQIRSKMGERAMIFGSSQLVVTKTTGFNKVYQAPLAAKPVGMGGARGKPMIFEWGTPSKPILDNDRRRLHKSRTHRLPYTEMFEAVTKAELDTLEGNGKWFWESGIIYFSATDGGDATLKQYEARARKTLIQNGGVLHLIAIDTFFGTSEGGLFEGILTVRDDCRTFGNYFNGYSDNSRIVKTLNDESGGNGNDGINGTITAYSVPDVNTRLTAHYVDPYVHDNGDDGASHHFRGNARFEGGLGEYNTKADFVHVTGATCVCDGTVSQGTLNGFYSATTATGDTERTASYFECVNTRARNNTYSYRAADDAILECVNTKAENPSGFGYYQTGAGKIVCEDAKYLGDPAKMKSGNVIVDTYTQVA